MKRVRFEKLTPLLLLVSVFSIHGDEPQPDKSGFTFLNPTPVDLLRPMTIDGPGATESAYTVDAGHFQVEMTLFSYSSYAEPFEGVMYRIDWWGVGPVTLKLGLLNNLDAHLVIEPYYHFYEREGDYYRASGSGFGDMTLRLKYNVWGNDSGKTALGVVPFVIFPTSASYIGNDHIEGGLKLPFEAELPAGFGLGLTSGFASAENELTNGRHAEFLNSIAVGREIIGGLAGYVEFFSAVSTERDVPWVGTFDFGFEYWLSDNLQLNTGVNIGLTSWADDWRAFAGMAWRF